MKTEDLALVRREYDYVARLARAKSPRDKEDAAVEYKLAQSGLLKQRDDFIAGMIKQTLKSQETGVLFIGAYHDIASRLPDSVAVVQVKEVSRAREYHSALATSKRHNQDFHQLARYMTSPIDKI